MSKQCVKKKNKFVFSIWGRHHGGDDVKMFHFLSTYLDKGFCGVGIEPEQHQGQQNVFEIAVKCG